MKLLALNEKNQQTEESDSQIENESDIETISSESHEEVQRHDLDTILKDMNNYLSPMKLHGVASHSKVALGKRKLKQFQDKMKE